MTAAAAVQEETGDVAIARNLKYRWYDDSDMKRALSPAAEDRNMQRVAVNEKLHGG